MKKEIVTYKTKSGLDAQYALVGEGEEIFVMIPGISLTKVTDMAGAVAASYINFLKKYRLYIFEPAENLPEGYTLEQMAEDIAEKIISLGLKNINLLGVSMGGMISQYIAESHPDLISKLVLASTCGRCSDMTKKLITELLPVANKNNVAQLWDLMCRKMFTKEFYESYRDFLIPKDMGERITDLQIRDFAIKEKSILKLDTISNIDKIKCKTLVIGAKHDEITGGEEAEFLAEKLGCECFMYEEYGHGLYDEAKDFRKKVLEFFTNC